jgi:hypothetical protein
MQKEKVARTEPEYLPGETEKNHGKPVRIQQIPAKNSKYSPNK